ncbi:MAG: hypothetical protein ABIN35_04490 [candidate division WOR-3 bacterium]
MKKNNNLISLYDLSFSLLFIFLFITVPLMNNFGKENERIKEKENFTGKGKNILQINIGEKELFNDGEFVFKNRDLAIDVIKNNLNYLYEIWKNNNEYNKKKIKNIIVVGHTDNRPIGTILKYRYGNPNYSNWNLSLDRANQVVNLIIQENMLADKPELSYNMLLPSGKSYFIPSTENLKEYFKNNLLKDTIMLDSVNIPVDSANSDQILKFLNSIFTIDEFNYIIEVCNKTSKQREKNRRIEIRLELWE